jgi:hypothetical protein
MAELLYKEESFKIIGICMEIHKTLGMGLKEINYKDARKSNLLSSAFLMKEKKGLL